MGFFETLDRMLFGEEALNRWKNERENSGFKSLGDINREKYIKEEEDEKIFQRKMNKYSRGHLFEIDQVPEFIKDKMIFWDSNLKSYWGKDYFKQQRRHELYSTFHEDYLDISGMFSALFSGVPRSLIPNFRIDVGIEYTENEQGKSALRVFKEKHEGL